jgi:hypothetical protein
MIAFSVLPGPFQGYKDIGHWQCRAIHTSVALDMGISLIRPEEIQAGIH